MPRPTSLKPLERSLADVGPPEAAGRPKSGTWFTRVTQCSTPVLIPAGAIIASLLAFGIFSAALGANPLAVDGSIYRAAFGNWYAIQNTLLRAAPLMLCSLCTAIPFRLGLIVIGNEGALIVGGISATLVGLSLEAAPPLIAQIAMALTGMAAGGLCKLLMVSLTPRY